MAVVTLAQVQQWLESTKLTLSSYDTELELTAERRVFAEAAQSYDVSGWVGTSTTPVLIQEIIAMFTAAWTYQRQYSEDSETGSWYVTWLEGKAQSLLDSVSKGLIDLLDTTQIPSSDSPVFWPTDAATSIADPLQNGDPADPNGAPRWFSMGKVF